MAYKVLIDFEDVVDKRKYKAGDFYEPKKKDEGRVASLLTSNNKAGRPLISWVDEPPKKKAKKKPTKKPKKAKESEEK